MALRGWVEVHDGHDGLVLVDALRSLGATYYRAEDAFFGHEPMLGPDRPDVSPELGDRTA